MSASFSPALLDKYAQAAKDAGLSREMFSVYLNASIVLQPKQLQFAAACVMCDYVGGPVEIGFGGARGGGKSHAGLAVLSADCLRYDGLTCLLLRKVGKANRENFNELRLKVLRGVHTVWKKQEGVLLFDNGSKIILGHFQNENDIDAYLGLEYDVILVEEATTLTAPKYKAIRTCNRSSKPGWRPRMYSTTNPGGVGHAWYKLRFIAPYKSGKQTATRFIPSTVEDNACVNAEYRDNLGTLTGWQKRAWLHGDWDIAAGQFFTSWNASVHVLPVRQMPKFIRGIHRPWASLDYGYTHYTTSYPFLKEDGDLFVLDEHAERRWLPARHAPAIHAMLDRQGMVVEDLAVFCAGHDVFAQKGDERAKTIADQYKELGIRLKAAKIDRITGASELLKRLGEPDGDPLDRGSGYIRPTIYISERCVRLIECIPSLEHDPHRPEDVLKVDTDDDGQGGDDSYDGARYGWMEAYSGISWEALSRIYDEEEHAALAADPESASFNELAPGRKYPLNEDGTLDRDGWAAAQGLDTPGSEGWGNW